MQEKLSQDNLKEIFDTMKDAPSRGKAAKKLGNKLKRAPGYVAQKFYEMLKNPEKFFPPANAGQTAAPTPLAMDSMAEVRKTASSEDKYKDIPMNIKVSPDGFQIECRKSDCTLEMDGEIVRMTIK